MKKKIFLFIVIIGSLEFLIGDFDSSKTRVKVVANREQLTGSEDFPDANFYSCVLKTLNLEEEVVPTDEQLASITGLDCANENVSNAKGIEKLINLKKLYLYNNQITSIDLSKNTVLEYLSIYSNQLTSIDLSSNIALKSLSLSSNQLTSIDLSKNIALTDLKLDYNQLTNLDVTKNVELEELDVSLNYLTSIDVTKNVLLEYFGVYFNSLTSLNVSGNTKLMDLGVFGNKISNLDLNSNTLLEYLALDYNNVKNINFSKLSEVSDLTVYYYDDKAIYGNFFPITNSWDFLPSGVVVSDDLSDVQICNRNDFDDCYWGDEIQNQTLRGNDGSSYFIVFELEEGMPAIDGYSGDVIYVGLKQLNFITLSSDKYKIDESNNIIDVDIDDDDTIKKNLKTNLRNVILEVEGTNLFVLYNNKVVKTFTLRRVTTNPGTGDIIFIVLIAFISSIIGVVLTTNIKFKEN